MRSSVRPTIVTPPLNRTLNAGDSFTIQAVADPDTARRALAVCGHASAAGDAEPPVARRGACLPRSCRRRVGASAAVASAGITTGLIGPGQRVTWRARHFGVWQQLTSEITAMKRPVCFQDTMVQGAFRSMRHDHVFRSLSSDRTEMKDIFCFAAPLPVLGRLAETIVLRRYMLALLRERNTVLKQIAESEAWQRYLP